MDFSTPVDPILVEVWRHLLESVAEEMGATLERTAFSPNIKERRDHSCALFDREGRQLSQAAHIPVHLGAMPLMMERIRHAVDWNEGDMWLCNDPQHGGTHLPDLTLVAPVFVSCRLAAQSAQDPESGRQAVAPFTDIPLPHPKIRADQAKSKLVGFVANRAHHADIGGIAPGSLSISKEIFHEGIILPPVRLVARGRIQSDVFAIVLANSRTPEERKGDLAAQIAANRVGIRRLSELLGRVGVDQFEMRTAEARLYSEAIVRNALSLAPSGEYRFTDYLDSDGSGSERLAITVTARIGGGEVVFDFTGSSPQVRGPMNATEAVTRSACYYAVRCLIEEDVPMNAATFAPVRVIAPEGTLVNALTPAAVVAGNVETSQRMVDVLFGALSQAFPDRIPAASQGTMNNLTIGGWDPIRQRPFAYYETICGGAGASPQGDGASAVHCHMTNTRNTPIEALEMHYPLRVSEYGIREGSGGDGEHRGGDGVTRTIEVLVDADVSIVSERRKLQPYGLAGGNPGTSGSNQLGDEWVGGKLNTRCEAGSTVSIATPGGGGWGTTS